MKEKEIQYLEEFIPHLAQGATKKAYLESLAKGQSVLEVIDGAIYEVFSDGRKRKIKDIDPAIVIDTTHKIELT
ncbi:MAG: hypothetical protein ACQESH_05240 [Campylobacterota bacterium]